MAVIRHEINILNSTLSASSDEEVYITPSNYNGTLTWYFEVYTTAPISVDLQNSAHITIATATGSGLVRVAFSTAPTAGSYHVNASSGSSCTVARVICIQNTGADPITASETQIDVGGGYLSTTSITPVALPNPKYWTYNSADWDGTISCYFEANIKNSSTRATNAVLQYSTDWNTWTTITGTLVTTSSMTTTRVRSSAFTPVNGYHYRVALYSGNSMYYAIFYASRIIVSQNSTSITKLEEQYLLLNTADSGTGLQNKPTKWNSSEWSGVTNTYKYAHDSNNASNSSKLVALPLNPIMNVDGTNFSTNQIFNGATGAFDVTRIAQSFVAPSSFIVDSINLPINTISATDNLTISIHMGGQEGTLVATSTVSYNQIPVSGYVRFRFAESYNFIQGTKYWIVASKSTSTEYYNWKFSATNQLVDGECSTSTNGVWSTTSGTLAFQFYSPENESIDMSVVTGANQQVNGVAFTMPITGRILDTNITNSTGIIGASRILVGTTVVSDTTPPAEVTNARAEMLTDSLIEIHWTNPMDSDLYRVGVSIDGDLGTEQFSTVSGQQGVEYSKIFTASATLDHTFLIRTFDASLNSSTGITCEYIHPFDAEVTGLSATYSSGNVVLSWTNPSVSDFNRVEITKDGTVVTTQTYSPSSAGTYTDINGGSGNHWYNLKTLNTTGNKSMGIVVNYLDTTSPSEVTNASASQNGSQVQLSWTNPTDNDLKLVKILDANASVPTTISQLSESNPSPYSIRSGGSFPTSRVGVGIILSNMKVGKIAFQLSKVGTPTGNYYGAIYSKATESMIVETGNYDISLLTTTYTWTELTFPTEPLINEEVYIVVVYEGGDGSNYLSMRTNAANVDNNLYFSYFMYSTSSWIETTTYDAVFTLTSADNSFIADVDVSASKGLVSTYNHTTDTSVEHSYVLKTIDTSDNISTGVSVNYINNATGTVVSIYADTKRSLAINTSMLGDIFRKVTVSTSSALDSIRGLRNSVSGLFDSTRKLINGIGILSDSKRAIRNTVSVLSDTKRVLRNNISTLIDSTRRLRNLTSFLPDTKRSLKSAVSLLLDSKRSITNTISVLVDTLRSVVKIAIINIASDTKRIIQHSNSVTSDSRRIVVKTVSLLNDTKRSLLRVIFVSSDSVRNITNTIINLTDTKRKILNLISITSDSIRKINNTIIKLSDTSRRIFSDVSVLIDIMRRITNPVSTQPDTKRNIMNTISNILADSKRIIRNTATVLLDTKRSTLKILDVNLDTFRKALNSQGIILDARRKILNTLTLLPDTKRKIFNLVETMLDSKRFIVISISNAIDSLRIRLNIISVIGDSKRVLRNIISFVADTKRNITIDIVVQILLDTIRHIKKNIVINSDSNRGLLNNTVTTSDSNRKLLNIISNVLDTKRILLITTSVLNETKRSLKVITTVLSDSKRGLLKNISSMVDSQRKLLNNITVIIDTTRLLITNAVIILPLDTLRKITTTNTATSDLVRKLLTSKQLLPDSIRKVVTNDSLLNDSKRTVIKTINNLVDSSRRLRNNIGFNLDSKRLIINTIQIVNDSKRYIRNSIAVMADTKRNIINTLTVLMDTSRHLAINIVAIISLDTFRKVVSSVSTKNDLKRIVTNALSQRIDTFRGLRALSIIRIDTVRKLVSDAIFVFNFNTHRYITNSALLVNDLKRIVLKSMHNQFDTNRKRLIVISNVVDSKRKLFVNYVRDFDLKRRIMNVTIVVNDTFRIIHHVLHIPINTLRKKQNNMATRIDTRRKLLSKVLVEIITKRQIVIRTITRVTTLRKLSLAVKQIYDTVRYLFSNIIGNKKLKLKAYEECMNITLKSTDKINIILESTTRNLQIEDYVRSATINNVVAIMDTQESVRKLEVEVIIDD